MASSKHTELKSSSERETLNALAQAGAAMAEFRTLSNGKGEYATYTIGGQVGPIQLPNGRVGYGRVTVNVNLTRVGTEAELAARQTRLSVADFASALSILPEDQRELVLATLNRK